MRRIATAALIALATVAPSAGARAKAIDRTAEMTDEVLDLFALESICGYSIDGPKLDIYLLGTHMFWGEPVSQAEIAELRAREAALIGDDAYRRTRRCRSVSDNFGPTGQRARGIAR